MSTWLKDIEKKNPALAKDWAIVGNQDRTSLRNMVRALSLFPILNTPEENERLAAAKRVLRSLAK